MEKELQTFSRMMEDVEKETFMELTCHTVGDPKLHSFSHFGVCLPRNYGGIEKDCSL